jgi:hypothetical protein
MGVLVGEDVCQIVSATYTDCVERRNGHWKIIQRSVTILYFNPVPGTVLIVPED